ncbi:hypothetical protein WICMUC_002466 [Wickerhamomyces mucosus]|uniref:SAC domain-containing protein n=1 Tax=Wickerhamomyces mucosus TaxID=1378264 RepID=A0A9P8PPM1_9ASCO|nr:hypothetical protein WICMUC_002466 [Wickerhamomyces mucosus]
MEKQPNYEPTVTGSVQASEAVGSKPLLANAASRSKKLILQKYTIYETSTRVYIIGSNGRETMFRVLEIDLTLPDDELTIVEDHFFFTRKEIMNVLSRLEEANPEGLTKKLTAFGLLGFVRFTKCYYLSVITERSPVAVLGGHYIYHIDNTALIPISKEYKKPDKYSEEARFLATFSNLDLSKTFYFSYTYDITNTLQRNILREKQKASGFDTTPKFHDQYNEMFVWNSALLNPIMQTYDRVYDWFQPIIHGFIDQANVTVFDKKIYITVIARRSHHFAGARFLKRGVNNQGNVANEVETEQIVSDMLTTSFHDSQYGFFNNPRYTSYVQHRGSIPLYWSQEATNLKLAKPPIEINLIDPFYSSAALHFDDMFKRYDSPVLVLNLVKSKERTPRESKLLKEFEKCITYLNRFLPDKDKIRYTGWDMSRASKADGQDVIEYLENYADETLKASNIFHNGASLESTQLQEGICRTNCIDCLDRTNAAQFVIGKRALGYQLNALGIIDDFYISYDSDVVNLLTEMFHDHGDTIALQYGGSHLVNTMETYRKINQWSSHSRDMIESIKRFYSNSFMDAQRQEAINLFLGNYVWEKGKPMIWDLTTDYYLHNIHLSSTLKRSYTLWWSENNLLRFNETFEISKAITHTVPRLKPYAGFFDNYWNEYYAPRRLSFFDQLFEINMNSTRRYITPNSNSEEAFEFSPFKARKQSNLNLKLKKKEQRKKKSRIVQIEDEKQNLSFESLESLVATKQLKDLKDYSKRLEGLIMKSCHDLRFDAFLESSSAKKENDMDLDMESFSIIESIKRDKSESLESDINCYEYLEKIEVQPSNVELYTSVCSNDYLKDIRRQGSILVPKLGNLSDELHDTFDVLPDVKKKDLSLYESATNLGIVGDYLNETKFTTNYDDNEENVMNFYL